MAKKEKAEKTEKTVKPVDTSVPDFTCWEKVTGKPLAEFVLTASIRDVIGTFTSEGKRFRTDMHGLTPDEIKNWMAAVWFCAHNNAKKAVEHLEANGFTVELVETKLFAEEEPEIMTVIMDGEPAEVEIAMEEEEDVSVSE